MLGIDVYILDNWNQIYVWIGPESNAHEKKAAYRNADKYIEALKDGRKKETIQIIEIGAAHEPPMFKVVFPNWSDGYSQQWLVSPKDSFESLKRQHSAKLDSQQESNDPFAGFLDPKENKFPYAELKNLFPKGVKHDKKEYYLSDAEFADLFKMSMADFEKLKLWKQ